MQRSRKILSRPGEKWINRHKPRNDKDDGISREGGLKSYFNYFQAFKGKPEYTEKRNQRCKENQWNF